MLAVVAFCKCCQREVLRGEKQVNTALRPERATQNRVIERITRPIAQGGLGYAYLGEWSKREGNRCIELGLLRARLQKRGY